MNFWCARRARTSWRHSNTRARRRTVPRFPPLHKLEEDGDALEEHSNMMDIEFTIEREKLYISVSRGEAQSVEALRVAIEMVERDSARYLRRWRRSTEARGPASSPILRPRGSVRERCGREGTGEPGAAVGAIVFGAAEGGAPRAERRRPSRSDGDLR